MDGSSSRRHKMKTFFILLLFYHIVSPVKHTLKFVLTGTSGVPDIPEFFASAVVNEVLIGYCDSDTKRPEPRQDWMRKLIKDDSQHFQWYSQNCFVNLQVFRANIDSLKQRLNQTKGPHVLQRMNGCEWDDETGEIKSFINYGYDGEDFLTFDMQTLTWIAPKQQAVITKLRWDSEKARLENYKNLYIHICPEWLKKYVQYGRSFLQKTELPSLSLLQKTPSSPVSCHATGFYAERAELFWRSDGEEIHEGVEKGEILPNGDGTFQMSVQLNISSVRPEDWWRYDCVFQLSGVNEDIVTRLDEAEIWTNWVPPAEFPVGPVVGVGVLLLLLLLLLAVIGVHLWRKKIKGEKRIQEENTSDSLMDNQ